MGRIMYEEGPEGEGGERQRELPLASGAEQSKHSKTATTSKRTTKGERTRLSGGAEREKRDGKRHMHPSRQAQRQEGPSWVSAATSHPIRPRKQGTAGRGRCRQPNNRKASKQAAGKERQGQGRGKREGRDVRTNVGAWAGVAREYKCWHKGRGEGKVWPEGIRT